MTRDQRHLEACGNGTGAAPGAEARRAASVVAALLAGVLAASCGGGRQVHGDAQATPDPRRKAGVLWCNEHGVPEAECALCHPELAAAAAAAGADASGRMCGEHRVAESECGICHPELAAGLAVGAGLKVRFGAAGAAALAGIESRPAAPGPLAGGVSCHAELEFDRGALARVAAPLGGVVEAVDADLGDRVAAGALLARVAAPEAAEAAARLVLARQTLERERGLHARRVTPERELQEAEAAYRAARERLRALGLDEERLAAVEAGGGGRVTVEVRAPFAGEIVARAPGAVRGAVVGAGEELLTLARRGTMWAMVSIPERDAAAVRTGLAVEIEPDALPGRVLTGRLTWVAAQVDERTRMVRARAEVPDPGGALRAGTFARARVLTGESEGTAVVPEESVQWVAGAPFVFVRLGDDLVEARAVRLGVSRGGTVAIAAGLAAGEPVVVAGGFLAKSQLLLSRLGAGCAE